MLFTIYATDKQGALATRLACYDAHKVFLADTSRFEIKILMSGPLVEDDCKTAKGSFFLIEAPHRAAVEAFNRADPFHLAGIWESTSIVAFLRRQG